MSAQTERLERVAAEERERLGEHLDELQQRLEKALDPSALFDRHPFPILATALVGGVILGAVTRSDGPARRRASHEPEMHRGDRMARGGLLHDGITQLRGAVVGMLFARLADMFQDLTSARRHDEPASAPERSAAQRETASSW